MAEQYMLTTVDNPYDPFTRYDEWLQYDTEKSYFTPQYLARVVVMSEEQSEEDQDQAIYDAIDEIVRMNVIGLYRKVAKTN